MDTFISYTNTIRNDKNPLHIVLFNEISGTGHFDSWTTLFTRILIDKGFKITCITPDTSIIVDLYNHNTVIQPDNLIVIPYDKIIPNKSGKNKIIKYYSRIVTIIKLIIWNILETSVKIIKTATNYIKNRKRASLTKNHGENFESIKNDKCIIIEKENLFQKKGICNQVIKKLLNKLNQHITVFHPGYHNPKELMSIIKKYCSEYGAPDLFFVMYLDKWQVAPRNTYKNEKLPCAWGGITFLPGIYTKHGTEWYFNQRQFSTMCLLDEQIIEKYKSAHPGFNISYLPDITNTSLPEKKNIRVKQLLNSAAYRKIVLLCGAIGSWKNIELFCKTARIADPDIWFFAIIGKQYPNTFTSNDLNLLSEFCACNRNNTFILDDYISDEMELNSFIDSSHVIFSVYKGFRKSSNMITKAGFFEKPILVSNKYLMGHRVKKYNIGLPIDENDEQEALMALHSLFEKPISSENFHKFQNDFSIDAFGDLLVQALRKHSNYRKLEGFHENG